MNDFRRFLAPLLFLTRELQDKKFWSRPFRQLMTIADMANKHCRLIRQDALIKKGGRNMAKRTSILLLTCLGIVLSGAGCTPASGPLTLQEVRITDAPFLGRITTMEISVHSRETENNVELYVDLPPFYHLVSGAVEWSGTINAGEVRVFAFDFCVLRKGSAAIRIDVSSSENPHYDHEVVVVESWAKSGVWTLSSDYSYNQEQARLTPTPDPAEDITYSDCN